MFRFFDAANAITLISLLSAVASVALAQSGYVAYAVVALILAGLCDLFDGLVARKLKRTDEQQRFGGRLDSLVDACAFGFAPPMMLYAIGLRHSFDLPLLGVFAICAIWRLAYFDTVGFETEGQSRYYTGLPTTYVALILPLVFLTAFASTTWFFLSIRSTVALLACAMVSSIRVNKPGGIAYACFLLLALGVTTLLMTYAPTLQSRFNDHTVAVPSSISVRS